MNVHFVPNGNISNVTNMSRDYAQSVIDVGVAYRENLDHVMSVMRQVGDVLYQDSDFSKKTLSPMEMVGVERLDDSAVVVRCRFKVLPFEQWSVRCKFFKRVKHAFALEDIEIPYPHLTLYPGQSREGEAPPLHIVTSCFINLCL